MYNYSLLEGGLPFSITCSFLGRMSHQIEEKNHTNEKLKMDWFAKRSNICPGVGSHWPIKMK
jgi:hypothetical protein